jgi:hypothetical protein
MLALLAGVSLTAGLIGVNAPAAGAAPAPAPAPAVTRIDTPPATSTQDKPAKGGVKAPKGIPGNGSSGGVSTLATGGPWFHYGKGSQAPGAGAFGLNVRLNMANPYLDTARDYHSLAEAEVEKTIGGQRNIVEVGWTKDPSVCAGKTNTLCLFVFWWKNGVAQCYNGCGFVNYASRVNTVGDAVPAADIGTGQFVYITYFSGNWWVQYKGSWLGYYPGTLWSTANTYGPAVAGFTDTDLVQAFAEVATGQQSAGVPDKPCTDMMNGEQGSLAAAPAVQIASAAIDGIPLANVNLTVSTATTSGTLSPYYTVNKASGRTFYVGGYGYNSAGTGAGTVGAC